MKLRRKGNRSYGIVVVIRGRDQGKHFQLKATANRLGRESTNDIQLLDNEASRSHAEIRCDHSGRQCELVDLGSSNGTLVNGARIQRHDLASGDRIEIGGTLLIFTGVEVWLRWTRLTAWTSFTKSEPEMRAGSFPRYPAKASQNHMKRHRQTKHRAFTRRRSESHRPYLYPATSTAKRFRAILPIWIPTGHSK